MLWFFNTTLLLLPTNCVLKMTFATRDRAETRIYLKKNFYFSIQILAIIMTDDIVIGGEQSLFVLITIDRIIIIKY